MGPAAAAGNIRHLVVAGIAVGMQVSIEPLQKLLWIFAAASGLVIVQYNGRQPIHAGTINPHVRLGLGGLAVLFENLNHRLICMQNFSLQKLFAASCRYSGMAFTYFWYMISATTEAATRL